jgi:hypothetical protein
MLKYLFILISAAFIACSPVRKYEKQPDVLAWENDIRQFEQLDRTEKYPDNAIIFAGSSSIRMWSTLANDMAPYPVIQRGYGGAKLSDFAVYVDRIIAPNPCRAIVLFVANDITGGESDKSPEEVAKLFRYILSTIRKSHPDTPVFWIAITPTVSRWNAWSEISKANDRIRKVCEKNKNTWFIRTDYAFLDEDRKPRTNLFIDDKLHLNQQGYAIWTGIIKGELDRVLSGVK